MGINFWHNVFLLLLEVNYDLEEPRKKDKWDFFEMSRTITELGNNFENLFNSWSHKTFLLLLEVNYDLEERSTKLSEVSCAFFEISRTVK